MKWTIKLIIGGALLYCFYINGFLAAIGLLISILTLFFDVYNNRGKIKGYSGTNAVLFFLSFILTFYPVVFKSENKVVSFIPAYADAIDNSQADYCPELSREESKKYSQIKNEMIMSCSSQDKIDLLHLVEDAIIAKFSFFSVEFSMASSLQAQNKIRNHCIECIEALIRVCPKEEKRFDKKSLLALRDAYKEYSKKNNLCRVKELQ